MMITGDKFIKSGLQVQANSVILQGALTAATDTTVGGVLKLENDFEQDLLITTCVINVTKASTGAATIDVGVDDGGDVSSDTLLDGLNAQTAKAQSNLVQGGTNGGMALWKKGEFVVATASATTAGMTGTYFIIAVPA